MCQCTSKSILGFLGLLFWAAAASLFAVSIIVFTTYNHFDEFLDSHYTLVPASIVLAVGFVFFLAGCMGLCTLCKDNRGLLFTFGTFLVILIGLLITAATCVLIYRGQIDSALNNQTSKVLNEYGIEGKDSVTKQADYVQSKLQCCGVTNYTDWAGTFWGLNDTHVGMVPQSCCSPIFGTNCTGSMDHPEMLFQQGCFSKLRAIFMSNLKYIAGAAIGLVVLLVIGVVCTCVLMCYKREEETPYFSLHN